MAASGCRTEPQESPQAKPATQPAGTGGRLSVFVSIEPQAYFVERVGGDLVNVQVLVGPGQSPERYEPPPSQLTALSHAKALFTVGVPFEESLVPHVHDAFPNIEIVDTSVGIERRRMEGAEAHEHVGPDHEQEEDEHAHPADGADPHIWLSPPLVRRQAETICDALVRLDPTHTDAYRANLAKFEADLDALHQRLTKALAPLRGREMFVFHPAFGYFADAYGLHQVPVEIQGKEPSARALAALIAKAQQEQVRVIFVQPQFSQRSAESIATAIGAAVVPLDPLARDYLANMQHIAERVEEALGE